MAPATRIGRRSSRRGLSGGAVLLAVLVFLLVTTLAANSLIASAQTAAQREREEQLLFAGDQYRRALQSYFNVIPPGGQRGLPKKLEDLLADHRFPQPMTHLRRLYPDPMSGRVDWELIESQGGVLGVRSRSERTPIKVAGFRERDQHFSRATAYRDWIFQVEVK
jgi:type II secretory pathway pseudopilin PulG